MFLHNTEGVSVHNKTTQVESLPFSYFMENKNQVISNLELELIRLKGLKYTCPDSQIPYIDREILNIKKAIRYNKALR